MRSSSFEGRAVSLSMTECADDGGFHRSNLSFASQFGRSGEGIGVRPGGKRLVGTRFIVWSCVLRSPSLFRPKLVPLVRDLGSVETSRDGVEIIVFLPPASLSLWFG